MNWLKTNKKTLGLVVSVLLNAVLGADYATDAPDPICPPIPTVIAE